MCRHFKFDQVRTFKVLLDDIFSLLLNAFCGIHESVTKSKVNEDPCPMFPSKNFMALAVTLRAVTYFELNFERCIK
jgi:hypothetical protein